MPPARLLIALLMAATAVSVNAQSLLQGAGSGGKGGGTNIDPTAGGLGGALDETLVPQHGHAAIGEGGGGGGSAGGGLGGPSGDPSGAFGGAAGFHGWFYGSLPSGDPLSLIGLNGGDGANVLAGGGGGGGAGGFGAVVTSAYGSTLAFDTNSVARGGAGGDGGWANSIIYRGGDAGKGGVGMYFSAPDARLLNYGLIEGGKGGDAFGMNYGQAANGGAGLYLQNASVENFGNIHGGDAGQALLQSVAAGSGIAARNAHIFNRSTGHISTGNNSGPTSSLSAVAIFGENLSIINQGLIEAIPSGVGQYPVAIQMTGGINRLELQPGSSIYGFVIGAGTSNTLALGSENETGADFDVTQLGQQYVGFSSFEKTGTNTWSLTGIAGHSTPWWIRSGTLAVAQESSLGLPTDVTYLDGGRLRLTRNASWADSDHMFVVGSAGGTLEIAQSTTGTSALPFTLTQPIGGKGDLTLAGQSHIILAADNTYIGKTIVDASGGVSLGNGGTSGSVASDEIQVNTLLRFHRSDDIQYTGRITGSGTVVNTNPNTLTLTGDSSGFTGQTHVLGGTLVVGVGGKGKLGGSVSVMNATLGGTGTIGNPGDTVTIGSWSTLSPGNSIGTLTIGGDLILSPNSTLRIEADETQSDRLIVIGKAILDGTLLIIPTESNSFKPRTDYVILSAGEVVNVFASIVSGYEFLQPEVAYAGDTVTLTLVRKDAPTPGPTPTPDPGPTPTPPAPKRAFRDAAHTYNQIATANGLESLPQTHALYEHIELLPAGVAPRVFDALSGEIHATTHGVLLTGNDLARRHSLDALRAALTSTASGNGRVGPLWVNVVGRQQRLGDDGNAAGVKQHGTGVFIGLNTALGKGWQLGTTFGYIQDRIKVDDRRSHSNVDNLSLTLNAGKGFETSRGVLNLMTGLGYTWHDIHTRRSTADSGLNQTLRASYRGQSQQAFAQIDYALPVSERAVLSPFATLAWNRLNTAGFTESGGNAGLSGKSHNASGASSTLGVQAQTQIGAGKLEALLQASAGWRHAFGSDTPKATLAFDQGQSYTLRGAPAARNAAVLSLGAQTQIGKHATISLSYGGQYGSQGLRDHLGQANLTWGF